MRIKTIIALCVSIFFTEFSTMAQQANKETINGYSYMIINCTTLPKNVRREATTTEAAATHTDADNYWNRLPYYKLALTASDISSSAITWSAANSQCSSYTGPSGSEGGKWRLPTQRELYLISMTRRRLESLSGFSSFTDGHFYWSSTKSSSNSSKAWHMDLSRGFMDSEGDSHYARCVREF